MRLTPFEKETILNFNEGEKTASVYTYNTPMRRRLDQLLKTRPDEISVVRSGEDFTEYIVPKKWIKVSPPRRVSEETKERARVRMNEFWQSNKSEEIENDTPEDDEES